MALNRFYIGPRIGLVLRALVIYHIFQFHAWKGGQAVFVTLTNGENRRAGGDTQEAFEACERGLGIGDTAQFQWTLPWGKWTLPWGLTPG